MRSPPVLTATILAALACRGPDADPAPARADARVEQRAPHADAAGAERTSGRRGDRHARAAARRRPSVKSARGTVTRASERQVVIRPAGGPELTLRVGRDTAVTLNGRASRAEALREGAEVRAAYRTGDGGRPTALSIDARAPAPPSRAPAAPAKPGDAGPPPPATPSPPHDAQGATFSDQG